MYEQVRDIIRIGPRACPRCAGFVVDLGRVFGVWMVVCANCGWEGPTRGGIADMPEPRYLTPYDGRKP